MSFTESWRPFKAGDDIKIGQPLYAAWSDDESEMLMFPSDQDHEAIAIAFGPAGKGQNVMVHLKGELPPKPSKAATGPTNIIYGDHTPK